MTSSIQSGATARGGRARAHSSKSAPFADFKAAQRRFIDFTRGSRVADGVRMMVRFRRLMKAARRGELGLTFVAPARVPLMGAIAKNAV